MNIHNLGSQIKKAHLSWTELSWSQWQQQREKTYLALTRELKKNQEKWEHCTQNLAMLKSRCKFQRSKASRTWVKIVEVCIIIGWWTVSETLYLFCIWRLVVQIKIRIESQPALVIGISRCEAMPLPSIFNSDECNMHQNSKNIHTV